MMSSGAPQESIRGRSSKVMARRGEVQDDDEEDRETTQLAEAMMRQVRLNAVASENTRHSTAEGRSSYGRENTEGRLQSSKSRLSVKQRPNAADCAAGSGTARKPTTANMHASRPSNKRAETHDFTFDIIERKRIERENMQLVKKLASINNRRQGIVPASMRHVSATAAKPKSSSRAGSAQINNRRIQKNIDRENEAFAKRLAQVRGTLQTRNAPSSSTISKRKH